MSLKYESIRFVLLFSQRNLLYDDEQNFLFLSRNLYISEGKTNCL